MDDRKDLTSGSVAKKLLYFALPIVAMNLLQAVYNIVDMIIVGQYVGSIGMSAVGTAGQVCMLVMVTCSGLSNGCAIYSGNLTGLRRQDEIKNYVGSMLSFLLILALVMAGSAIIFRHPFLAALNTPAESYEATESYLIISMLGTVFVYGYGLLSAALRGIGESVQPLKIVLFTTLENVALDFLFVAVIPMGAAGAALATIISQATSFILVAIYTYRHTCLFDFRLSSFRIHPDKLKAQLALGTPQAIQYVCTNISFLFIASLVNSYGISASAAANAANKLGSFGTLPGIACMTAIVTLTAQNHPLKNYKRIIHGMLWALGLCLGFAMIFLVACQAFPGVMYGFFTDDPNVLEVGTDYLRWFSISFIDENIMFCFMGIISGAGYTRAAMVSGIISSFGVRFVAAYLLSHFTALGFNGIALAYSCAPLVGISICSYFFITGKWKILRHRT